MGYRDGTKTVVIQNTGISDAVFELTSDFRASTKNFKRFEFDFTNLSGTKLSGDGSTTRVDDVFDLNIAAIQSPANDGTFRTVVVTINNRSEVVPSISSSPHENIVKGSFFGPQAQEIGGVIFRDDGVRNGGNGVVIRGNYLGVKD